jgi:hypothetical protein
MAERKPEAYIQGQALRHEPRIGRRPIHQRSAKVARGLR